MPYWTVRRSAPGHDVLAYEGVVRAGYEIFTPKIRIRVGKLENKPAVRLLLLVRVVDQWRALERTIGVLCVVKAAGMPAKCPDEQITTLIARSDADGVIRLSSSLTSQSVVRRAYEPGAKVAIADGPFRGFNGLHTGMTTRDRELVLINILGASRPVEIAAGLLAPS